MAFVVSELSLSQQSLCCWWALGEEATLGGRAGDGATCPPAAQRLLWLCCLLPLCAGEAPGLAEDAAGRDSSEAVLCRGFRAGHLTSSLNSTDNYQLKAGFRFSELGWFLCSCIQL